MIRSQCYHIYKANKTTHLSVGFCFFPCIPFLTGFVFVTCQDAEGLPVEVKVRSKGDGLHSCSYMPTSSIKHTVAVSWGGVSIPNSPFRVSSQSQHPVTALIKSKDPVQSDCLVKAERVEVEKFEPIVLEESLKKVESGHKAGSSKTKKPLIIITTYTEERYSF